MKPGTRIQDSTRPHIRGVLSGWLKNGRGLVRVGATWYQVRRENVREWRPRPVEPKRVRRNELARVRYAEKQLELCGRGS